MATSNNDFFTIFIFPFKYEMKGKREPKPDEMAKVLCQGNKDPQKGWVVEDYRLALIENYNDVTRRVYPPFLRDTGMNTCEAKQKGTLPTNISLFKDANILPEDFPHLDLPKEAKTEKDILYLSKIIQGVLHPFKLKERDKLKRGIVYYIPFIDDRMFIVSYFADEEVSNQMKERCCDGYGYETSEDVNKITKEFKADFLSEIKNKTQRLRSVFIKFTNKYWFIEVTPQEQGIEIYKQWLGLLDLQKLYDQIEKEISELAGYVETRIESETNTKMAWITYAGFPLLILKYNCEFLAGL
ncbi:MAG: hypothetical protein AB1595_03010 [bacterium]